MTGVRAGGNIGGTGSVHGGNVRTVDVDNADEVAAFDQFDVGAGLFYMQKR